MALSIFLRNSARSSLLMNRQISKLVSPVMIAPRMFSIQSHPMKTILPSSSTVFKDATRVPLMNAVRSLRTSSVALHLDGHENDTPHDHARLWLIEWYASLANMVLVPIGLIFPNTLVDLIISVTISAHAFWGLQAIAVEYIRVILFGEVLPKVAVNLAFGIACVLLGGFLFLTFNGDGVTGSFWKLWKGMNGRAPPPGGYRRQGQTCPCTPKPPC